MNCIVHHGKSGVTLIPLVLIETSRVTLGLHGIGGTSEE